jgi:hypothetical protein
VEVKRGEGKDPEKLRGLKYIIHIHMKTAQWNPTNTALKGGRRE